jgi:hypothetical protein
MAEGESRRHQKSTIPAALDDWTPASKVTCTRGSRTPSSYLPAGKRVSCPITSDFHGASTGFGSPKTGAARARARGGARRPSSATIRAGN